MLAPFFVGQDKDLVFFILIVRLQKNQVVIIK